MEVSGQLHAQTASPQGKEGPGTHWIKSWVGPSLHGHGAEEKKCVSKILFNPTKPIYSNCSLFIVQYKRTVLHEDNSQPVPNIACQLPTDTKQYKVKTTYYVQSIL
jgi:hypothetical protein